MSTDDEIRAEHQMDAISARARGDHEAERRALDALVLLERRARAVSVPLEVFSSPVDIIEGRFGIVRSVGAGSGEPEETGND